MRDKIWYMVLVLTVVGLVAGVSLAAVKKLTDPVIENRILDGKIRPGLEELLRGAEIDNNPIADRLKLDLGKDAIGRPVRLDVFRARKGQKITAVALKTSSTGFGGDVEVLTVLEVDSQRILGARALSLKETKGLGTRVGDANEPFVKQFVGLDGSAGAKLRSAGGKVDAITGATVTSAAFTAAVDTALRHFDERRDVILGQEVR